jgi:hypothetical protein
MLEWLTHFASQALGVTVAILLLTYILPVIRGKWPESRFGSSEIGTLLEGGGRGSFDVAPPIQQRVNVEFRDADGKPMSVSPLVSVTLRNTYGPSYQLSETVFEGCNPDYIRVGARVEVSIGGGLVRESLRVRLDPDGALLYVKSGHTWAKIFRMLNGDGAE